MTIKEKMSIIEKAFGRNEFKQLFRGDGEYYLPMNRMVCVGGPTDDGFIFSIGLPNLCEEKGAKAVKQMTVNAIRELLNGTVEELMQGFNCCWSQLYFECKNETAFKIFDDNFIAEVKGIVCSRRAELQECKEYPGERCDTGLWDLVARLNKVLINKFNVSLL